MERGKWKGENGKRKGEGEVPNSIFQSPFSIFHSPSSILRPPFSIVRLPSFVSRWAPVLLWMATIFYFSSRRNPLGFLPSSGLDIDVGDLAHICEYAGLAALLHRALREHGSGGPSTGSGTAGEQGGPAEGKFAHNPNRTPAPLHLYTPALIALAYAIFDELHQAFVPGRGSEVTDIGLDLIGVIAALGLIWIRGVEGDTKVTKSEGKKEKSRGIVRF